jgi:hypothetical protein
MKQGQYATINELAAKVVENENNKKDLIVSPDSMLFSGTKLNIYDDNVSDSYTSTKHMVRQTATAGGIPTGYMEKLYTDNPELMARNLNWGLGNIKTPRMVRTLDGNARAMMSDRYKIIDNAPVLESAMNALKQVDTDVEFQSMDITDNRMYLKMTSPRLEGEVKKDDPVQMGLVISNSEIGLGSYQIQPLIYRLVCENGMVSPKEIGGEHSIQMKHLGRKNDLGIVYAHDTQQLLSQAFAAQVRDIIHNIFSSEMLERHLQAFRDLANRKIEGAVPKAIEVVQKKFNLTNTEGDTMLKHLIEGGDLSQYGILNSITRTARDVEDYDRASHLEAVGGKIITLSSRDWKDIKEAA